MTDRIYNIGDRVRVIAGARRGEVTTVESALVRSLFRHCEGRVELMLVHHLGLGLGPTGLQIAATPSWLEPYRDDDREPAEEVESWIADLCKRKVRAR